MINYSSLTPGAAAYNALYSVEDADRMLCERDKSRIIHDLLSIISSNGLSSSIGLRLLHKHNDISEDEAMFESLEHIDGDLCLITKPVAGNINLADVRVNSWRVETDGTLQPLEFSDGGILASFDINSERCHRTFQELAERILKYGINDFIGICVDYKVESDDVNLIALETIDEKNRSNIVKFINIDAIDIHSSLETKWFTSKGEDPAIKVAKCKSFCSVKPEGGHLGTSSHRPG